jgi:hypothetical protein
MRKGSALNTSEDYFDFVNIFKLDGVALLTLTNGYYCRNGWTTRQLTESYEENFEVNTFGVTSD